MSKLKSLKINLGEVMKIINENVIDENLVSKNRHYHCQHLETLEV